MSFRHPYTFLAAFSLAMAAILQACGEPDVTTSVISPVATPSSDNYDVTNSEVAFALDVLANDRRAVALIGETPYEVTPGVVQDKNQQKTGVMLRLLMSEPISVEGDWLRKGEVYALSACNAPLGVRDIMALVDFALGQVTSLKVGPGHFERGATPEILPYSPVCGDFD